MSFGFDAYRTVSNSSSKRPFDTETNGGGLRLGLPITDEFQAQVNYKISQQTISNSTTVPAYFPNGTRLTSSAGYVLTYSTLDNRQDPREGVYVRFAQDFAGIGGDARFVRTTGDARYYHPLWPDSELIGMLQVQGGNILGLGQSVAIQDNFFKGAETVRGFAPLGFGPRDIASGVAIGGKNYAAATAEVQFPLPLLPPDFGLRGAVFADAGMLFGVDNPGVPAGSYNDDTAIRSSVGASILWASPFGLLRADFAHVLSKQSYDQTQFFRLGAGTTF
jgi:outer membrane protein insertion porin family